MLLKDRRIACREVKRSLKMLPTLKGYSMTSRIRVRVGVIAAIIAAGLVPYLLLDSAAAQNALPAAQQVTLNEIAVFQRSSEPADSPPSNETTITGVIRKIGAPTDQVWGSVTGQDEVCVQVAEGASACTEPGTFGEKPLIVGGSSGGPRAHPASLPTSLPGPSELGGIAPNNIATVSVEYSNGTSETKSVVNNGFAFAPAGRDVKQFKWTTTAGVTHAGPVYASAVKGA